MLSNLWEFLGSSQFQHLASLASTLAIFVLIPLYRKLSRMIAALHRIPVIETILTMQDERISELEAHRPKPFRHLNVWPL